MTTCVFGPLTLAYDERVLEPRPWTLLQSEWAAELAGGAGAGPLLELCAGAGHIGLAAAVLSGRELVQVEVSPVAARFARTNASAAGMAERVRVREASLFDALHPDERFPLVIADPPYLPSREVAQWPADPVLAIDGGPDGLDVVRTCLRVAADHTAPGAPLLLQVAGDRQVEALAGLRSPFSLVDVRRHDPERAVVLMTRGPTG
ncbi:class I SAM-dependent methyltransferase [Jatrophihabitans fulvus]